MQFQFDPDQRHQRVAWESVCALFKGQEGCEAVFSMPAILPKDDLMDNMLSNHTDKGTGNRLRLSDEAILQNLQEVQLKNGLTPSDALPARNFTIEMETGTGKTYVYLRSIFEMNAQYGFTKFIIVVPSIAIKEGVAKSLDMTATHFKGLYNNAAVESFVYDSARLEQVRAFAANDAIQIMVTNIQAFQNTDRVINRHNDRMQGRPIDFISSTNPIVIIDEPQSVVTTDLARAAIASLNPLCTFRYSATHRDKEHHMIYRLDAVDAYEQKLVKQIEVASVTVEEGKNKPYVKLLKVDNKNGFRAWVEVDVQEKNQVKRIKRLVKPESDLEEITNRGIYEGYIVKDIHCAEGNQYIDFTSNENIVRLHQAINEVDDSAYKRRQIRKTIEVHLDKELMLTPMDIKVLSLFFIDKVANYRDYDAPDGKGLYAKIFEEEYALAIKKPKYADLFEGVDKDSLVGDVHEGYFSKDKKGLYKDTSGSSMGADQSTYTLIMKHKERLLSFDSKLKFIFSHSALKEGWDNPNVFQICTLNETGSIIKKRQEIGRGMRIAVNQKGERIGGFDVNTLTVMANESYADFVDGLQKEMEDEGGIRFHRLNIKNNDDKRTVKLNREVFESPEFKELWDRVKHKTIYSVDFNSDALIKECAEVIYNDLSVSKTRFVIESAKVDINREEISTTNHQASTHIHDATDYPLPDILSYLQNETNLKRKTIQQILVKSRRLDDFIKNPQMFIDGVKNLIKQVMSHFIVDGIKYEKIGDACFYEQELFDDKELTGYINKNMLAVEKSAYDHVVWDSSVEEKMAAEFEARDEVKVYAKLPSWFKIDTPLGSYNPDWAVLWKTEEQEERLYFIVETKGSNSKYDMSDLERGKTDCGEAHFIALGTVSRYMIANDYKTFEDKAFATHTKTT